MLTDVSDHCITTLSANIDLTSNNHCNKKFVYKRKHCETNLKKLKQNLAEIKWNEILDNNDVNHDYNKFTETVTKVYDDCIPLKKCTVKRKKDPLSPWITKGLLKSINKKNKLYKHYINTPTEGNLQKFKTYKNKLNMLIRKSKRSYYYNKFENSKSNMRETWKEINCIIGKAKKRSTHCKFKDEEGNTFTDPQSISNKFNDFFVNVGLTSTIHNDGNQYYDYLQDINSK